MFFEKLINELKYEPPKTSMLSKIELSCQKNQQSIQETKLRLENISSDNKVKAESAESQARSIALATVKCLENTKQDKVFVKNEHKGQLKNLMMERVKLQKTYIKKSKKHAESTNEESPSKNKAVCLVRQKTKIYRNMFGMNFDLESLDKDKEVFEGFMTNKDYNKIKTFSMDKENLSTDEFWKLLKDVNQP